MNIRTQTKNKKILPNIITAANILS